MWYLPDLSLRQGSCEANIQNCLLPTVGREYFIDCAITDVVSAQEKVILANKRHKHSNLEPTS